MFRFILLVVDLFRWLPWWGAVGVLALMAVGLWGLGHFIVYRLRRDLTAAVLAQGTPLTDALVDVHSIEPAPSPTEPSLIGLDPDDEDYDPELDELDDPGTTGYFQVDATIAPHDPQAEWDPTAVFVVQRDFEPEEELDLCEEMGLIHALEVWRNGKFVPHREGNVTGPQRVRMVLAVPHGLTNAKFAYHFAYFGSLNFPAPVALAHS
jgi:hypothetical protein